ncbi:MAG: hypothetical protein JNL57_06345 [Bacteroidetes bacterium]|nr:hypothetical protein [Bacteroidota bacterium]
MQKQGRYSESATEWIAIYRQYAMDSALCVALADFWKAKSPDSIIQYTAGSKDACAEKKYRQACVMLGIYKVHSADKADTALYVWLSLLNAGRWKEAQAYQKKLHPEKLHPATADLQELARELDRCKWKKKGVAAGLGLIPGMGKVYAGHGFDAFTSASQILINAGGAWYSYSRWGKRSFWPWFFAANSAAWYAAGIAGSGRAVAADRIVNAERLKRHAKSITYLYFLD